MANDLALLKELEKEVGHELPRWDFDRIIGYKNMGFAADGEGRIIGLNLEGMGLKAIPALLPRFRHLERLRLDNNKISDLSPLCGLNKLTYIELTNNQVSDLSPLSGLKKLTHLDLKYNKISDLSPLSGLNKLTKLYLDNNQVSDIEPLSRLNNLAELWLDSNQVSDLSALSGLNNLTTLILENNQISDLKPLCGLDKLTYINLGYNQISDLEPLSGLNKLERLNLINNNIAVLPPQILDLVMEFDVEEQIFESKDKIYLYGNPLEQPPPEIIKQGKEAMRAYFRGLEETQLPLREAKILLVGDGGAGKTSLVKCLKGGDYDPNESQTHGINIDDWAVNKGKDEIKAHLWDFGGQEIMHATHQFFLSKRSLYVLVLDGRRDEKTEYWLKHTRSFGGDSPVLVVLNKIDQNPGHDINPKFLRQKYTNIKGFYRLSCADKTGLPEFRAALQEELAKVELIHTTWPQSWFEIKKELEDMTHHFIDRRQYEAICKKAAIKGKTNREVLLEFLNDLGVVLHFKDYDLQDTHVLEPEWVTGGVYKIINSQQLAEKQGVLELSMLDAILEKKEKSDYDYPPGQYRFIIGLMEKFEICYPLDRGSSVLVPDLLPAEEPDFEFDYNNALRFIVEYDFLPRSVMPRFIVNMYKDIEDDLQWRTGVVLADPDFAARALVRADNDARRIYIYVTGKQQRDYFAALLLTLRRINGSFEKLKTKELIPMPDDPEITALYKQLVEFERMGVEYYATGESEKKYKVKDLLGTITGDKAITEEEILQILKKIAANTDTKDGLAKKLNDVFSLQLPILGVNINISAIIDRFIKKKGAGK